MNPATVSRGGVMTGLEGKVLWIVLFLSVFAWDFSMSLSLSGQVNQCDKEGEHIIVPMVAANPCYKCFCRGGQVECENEKCQSVEGCHAVLFIRPSEKCCDVCKGCSLNGTRIQSGSVWPSQDDPCRVQECLAGVLTISKEVCSPPCHYPVPVAGQCCPSCSGCFFDGQDHESGEIFRLNKDASVECVCKGGNVTCSKRACPVLNCAGEYVYQPPGEHCPRCRGHRMIFAPMSHCYFAKRVFNDGVVHIPDSCTSCQCQKGTMVCEKKTCPPLTCPPEDYATVPKSCCPVCRKKKNCTDENVLMEHGDSWLRDNCEICRCKNGKQKCKKRKCPNPITSCPEGWTLSSHEEPCCPICKKGEGKCTLRGPASNSVSTFDQRTYHTEGFCVHDLVRDCFQGHFAINGHYSINTKDQSQLDRISVRFGATRVQIHRNMKIRVNRTSIPTSSFKTAEFSILIKPTRIFFKVNNEFSVIWNMNDSVNVKVSSKFYGVKRLCGMCGNFNGDPSDDIVNRNDKVIHEPRLMAKTWIRGVKCRELVRNGGYTISSKDNPRLPPTSANDKGSHSQGSNNESGNSDLDNAHDPISQITSKEDLEGHEAEGVPVPGYCNENTVEWMAAEQDCSVVRNIRLQHCDTYLQVTKFMSSCLADLCKCQGDTVCTKTKLSSYFLHCNLAHGKAIKSWDRSTAQRAHGLT